MGKMQRRKQAGKTSFAMPVDHSGAEGRRLSTDLTTISARCGGTRPYHHQSPSTAVGKAFPSCLVIDVNNLHDDLSLHHTHDGQDRRTVHKTQGDDNTRTESVGPYKLLMCSMQVRVSR